MAGRRPGRTPKGGKRQPVRFPDAHAERYVAEARDRGMSLSDYVASVMAKHHGLETPWPAAQHGTAAQPELDLAAA